MSKSVRLLIVLRKAWIFIQNIFQSQIMSQEIVSKSAFLDCNVAGHLSHSILASATLVSKFQTLPMLFLLSLHVDSGDTCKAMLCSDYFCLLRHINCNNRDTVYCVSKRAVTRMSICLSNVTHKIKNKLQRILHYLYMYKICSLLIPDTVVTIEIGLI